MPGTPKRWQALIRTIETLDPSPNTPENPPDDGESVYVYGETIEQLRQATRAYLLKKRPIGFANRGDHIVGNVEYAYDHARNAQVQAEEEGWWCYEQRLHQGRLSRLKGSFIHPPTRMNNFEDAVDHFVHFALIPEKGPDYRSKALVGNDLRFPLLERILRETEEYPINDLIQRGWHIIALEYQGEASITGELINRKANFVLGHPDAQAALLTLDSQYYVKSWFETI